MKLLFLSGSLFLLTVSADQCGTKKSKTETTTEGRYKAKLEIKALCMNYTLRQIDGNVDTSLVAATWTDESTGKSYSNAFGLANPCDFPATIKEGDEFYFVIDSSKTKDCAVCMAYYPTPPKKLYIKVVDQ